MNIRYEITQNKNAYIKIISSEKCLISIPKSMQKNIDFIEKLKNKAHELQKKYNEKSPKPLQTQTSEDIYIYGEKFSKKNLGKDFQQKIQNEFLQDTKKLVDTYTQKLGMKYQKLTIRTMKSRWGSCTSTGNICINFLLVHLPKKYLEYVVVHEVCHLIEHNHSQKFWSLVEKMYPDYKAVRKELKGMG